MGRNSGGAQGWSLRRGTDRDGLDRQTSGLRRQADGCEEFPSEGSRFHNYSIDTALCVQKQGKREGVWVWVASAALVGTLTWIFSEVWEL